jgi:dTDP-4-dehydrorhamnose reductase
MMKPTVLLLGKNGQVGHDLAIFLPQVSRVISLGRDQLDLSQFNALHTSIRETKPSIIVNAAAYTAVDRAESETDLAHTINADALCVIGEEARKINATVIHYSTDYVFDGTKTTPYLEDDFANPINAYGRTKLDGELALEKSGAEYFVLRTSWVYSTRGHNFLLSILKLATLREELRVVHDQVGAPTWSRMIAAATANIIEKLSTTGTAESQIRATRGTYHMTAAGQTSWHGFAEAILEECTTVPKPLPWFDDATEGKRIMTKQVRGIPSNEYPTPARRPHNSLLSNEKLHRVFGFRLPDWRQQLRRAVRDSTPDLESNEFPT